MVSSFKSFINLLISLLREILFKFLYLNPVAPYGLAKRAMKKYLLNSQQLYDLGQKYLQLTFDGIIAPGNSYWKENLNHIGDKDFNPFGNALHAMSLGVYNFSISQNGECYLDSKMKAANILYLGNAISENIEQMWHSKNYHIYELFLKKEEILLILQKFSYNGQHIFICWLF